MVRLSEQRLMNHPERNRISPTNGLIYLEMGLEIVYAGKGSVIASKEAVSGDYAFFPKMNALVIALDQTSDLYTKYNVRPGDTVFISRDVNIEPYTKVGINEQIPNPFCALYTFKTAQEQDGYSDDLTNGPTILIEGFKVCGVVSKETPEESYPPKLPTPKILMTPNDISIIN